MNIEIEHDPSLRAIHLWMFTKTKTGEEGIVLPISLTARAMTPGERPAPTLTLPYREANDLFQSLAEVLSKERIEMPSEATLKGTLEAQKAHLEDLRKLLKLR